MIVKSFGSEGWRSSEKVGEGWVFLGDILEVFQRYLVKVGDEDAVKSTPKTGQDNGRAPVDCMWTGGLFRNSSSAKELGRKKNTGPGLMVLALQG